MKDEATKEMLSFRIKKICYVTESLCSFQGFVVVSSNFLLLVLVQSALDGTEGGMQPHNRT